MGERGLSGVSLERKFQCGNPRLSNECRRLLFDFKHDWNEDEKGNQMGGWRNDLRSGVNYAVDPEDKEDNLELVTGQGLLCRISHVIHEGINEGHAWFSGLCRQFKKGHCRGGQCRLGRVPSASAGAAMTMTTVMVVS